MPVTILKVVGIELTSIGRFEPEGPHEEVIALEEESAGRYRKLVISGDRIVGAILLGFSAEASPVVTAVKRSYDVGALLPEPSRGALGRPRRTQRRAGAGAGGAGEPQLGLGLGLGRPRM